MNHHPTPDLMPVLSRGKHRNPRKGGCFMELASYLAGEPWSDHPRCTHPLLAALAREVNDHVCDATRLRLAPMIPEVIGLTGDDPRVDAWIARDAALAALPIASAEKQGVLALGLLRCEQYLARIEGRSDSSVSVAVSGALEATPQASAWATKHYRPGRREPATTFRERSAPVIVHAAVSGIAVACVDDPEPRLIALLRSTIDRCQVWLAHETAPVPEQRWREVCALTAH